MAHEVIDNAVHWVVVVTWVPAYLLAANNLSTFTVALLIVLPLAAILLKPDIASTIVYGIANIIESRRDPRRALPPTHQISEEMK